MVFTKNQAQGSTRRCRLVAAVEVISEALLQVAAVADVQLAVRFREKDVDAVAELGEFLHAGNVSATEERNKCGRHRAVETRRLASLHGCHEAEAFGYLMSQRR